MIEAAGVAVFALTGALVAIRKKMDPFGFILLATATGTGGGTLRELLLGRPVLWIEAPLSVVTCVGVALAAWGVAYLKPGRLDGWGSKRLLLWADAAGLALFAVSGTREAIGANVPLLSAIALGTVTASFGGILRDILAGDRAMVLWSRDFYVTAAAASATATALLTHGGFGHAVTMAGGLLAGFGLRAGSILLGWSFPRLPEDKEPR